jgi:DNA invertase Pin-like site-specific DNA recombinase
MFDVNDDAKGGFRRVEILTGPGRRRRWSAVEKARIVAETLEPGARVAERPEGEALLQSIQAGDTIITPKLDRMFRSALDALDVLGRLKGREVALHMIDLGGDVTGNGISKLVFTILPAVAEAERDRIRERVATVKADQRARGRYLGAIVPFGWHIGDAGELVKKPEQQQAIRRMQELRKAGLSLRAIANEMAESGHRLSHEGVKKIISASQAGGSLVAGELI